MTDAKAAAWRRIVDPTVLFLLLAVLWEKAVDLFHIKRYLLPPLSDVLRSMWTNRAILVSESLVTVQEVLWGFLLAVVGGVLLGLAIHAAPVVRRSLYPLIVVFQGLPKIALAPLMVIWFGYGYASQDPDGLSLCILSGGDRDDGRPGRYAVNT